jgi:hypothetical protein
MSIQRSPPLSCLRFVDDDRELDPHRVVVASSGHEGVRCCPGGYDPG